MRSSPGRLLVSGLIVLAGCAAPSPSSPSTPQPTGRPTVLLSEFLFDRAPFRSVHASTIVDTPRGLVAAFFAGTEEGHPDVGIWVSRHEGGHWLPPVEVATGQQEGGRTRFPCWNPVLFQAGTGPLILFYKVGPNPREWWGMRMESADHGRTWSAPERLPDGILGPVRNKPIRLPDGSWLCGSSTEDKGWRVHFEWTPDAGRSWARTPPLNDARTSGLIQPTLLAWRSGHVQMLCRSQQGHIYESWMGAQWTSWTPPGPTALPNPNSGIDAVMLRDGRGLLVYNRTPRGRTPLNVAVSREGRAWTDAVALEDAPGEYSYPAVIQAQDGTVHVTWTWKRQRIKHAVLDPRNLPGTRGR